MWCRRLRKPKAIAVIFLLCILLIYISQYSIWPLNSRRLKKPVVRFDSASEKSSQDYLEFNDRIIVYNRLPKCASTITRIIIKYLQTNYPKRFELMVENTPFLKQVLNIEEQSVLAARWSSTSSQTLYIRHIRFLDFPRFGYKSPIYINIIRDPVEQFVSAYYFNRFGFVGWSQSKIKKWLKARSEEDRHTSLETCILKNVSECVSKNPARYFSYFCGHEDKCNDLDRWSLERAKENVMKYFFFVGIAEEYNKSLWVMEKKIPSFFANITELYLDLKKKDRLPVTKTANKVRPSAPALQKLQDFLHLRVEFYEFIKERLKKQIEYFSSHRKTSR